MKKAILLIIFSLLVIACGSSGGGSSGSGGTEHSIFILTDTLKDSTATITVFGDLNGNGVYDNNREPVGSQNSDGSYSLTLPEGFRVTSTQKSAIGAKIEGLSDATYYLYTPAGTNVISPLTTMVHKEMSANNVSLKTAQNTIAANLNISDPDSIFSTSGYNAEITNAAKYVAESLVALAAAIDASAVATDKQKSELMDLLFQAIMDVVANIVDNSNPTPPPYIPPANIDTMAFLTDGVYVLVINGDDIGKRVTVSGVKLTGTRMCFINNESIQDNNTIYRISLEDLQFNKECQDIDVNNNGVIVTKGFQTEYFKAEPEIKGIETLGSLLGEGNPSDFARLARTIDLTGEQVVKLVMDRDLVNYSNIDLDDYSIPAENQDEYLGRYYGDTTQDFINYLTATHSSWTGDSTGWRTETDKNGKLMAIIEYGGDNGETMVWLRDSVLYHYDVDTSIAQETILTFNLSTMGKVLNKFYE